MALILPNPVRWRNTDLASNGVAPVAVNEVRSDRLIAECHLTNVCGVPIAGSPDEPPIIMHAALAGNGCGRVDAFLEPALKTRRSYRWCRSILGFGPDPECALAEDEEDDKSGKATDEPSGLPDEDAGHADTQH